MGFGTFGGGGGRILYETVEEDLSAWGPELFGDPTKFLTWDATMNPVCADDADPQIIAVPKSLRIPAGVTMTPSNRCKGLYLFVNGHLKIDGTISMTARGASAVGVETPLNPRVRKERRITRTIGSRKMITQDLWDQTFGSIGSVPAVGGAGGAGGVGSPYTVAQIGVAGTNRAPGGGGGGSSSSSSGAYGGDGGDGTAFSGGSGGGGVYGSDSYGGNASDTGGAGGAGVSYTNKVGGGAGNPGGAGYGGAAYNGGTGTGGVLFIVVRGSIFVASTGVISSNGVSGGDGDVGFGGGSGGGSINIVYGMTYVNSGTVQANGGPAGGESAAAGGAGCVTIEQVARLVA